MGNILDICCTSRTEKLCNGCNNVLKRNEDKFCSGCFCLEIDEDGYSYVSESLF